MNASVQQAFQGIDPTAQLGRCYDAAIALLETWIGIVKTEIRAECSSRRPLGKRVTPLTRRLNEAVLNGRRLRPDDLASIDATITRYAALIEAHRAAQTQPTADVQPA